MKTIGIKLADGSFYPVLQEGLASEKKLDLTTAHNNQTKVMVDLYRSASCSMDDAEYVDSLQIENLVAHPNGEADISFSVSLDENKQLSARIVDTETGKESNTTITLVSRTQEERLITDEYDISDSEEENKKNKAALGAVAGVGLLAAATAIREQEEKNKENEFNLGDPDVVTDPTQVDFKPAANDEIPTDEEIPSDEELPSDESISSDVSMPSYDEEIPTDDTIVSEEDMPEIDFELPDNTTDEEPALKGNPFEEETPADETIISDDSMPSFDEEIPTDQTFSTDETISADDTINDDINFDFPGDDSDQVLSNASKESSDIYQDDTDKIIEEADTFDLPDFADISTETEEATESNKVSDDLFNMDEDLESSLNTNDDVPATGGISFTGLYDKDDLSTTASSFSDEEDDDVKKKTKVPVIICIVCAIICIIATLLVLFIIPSKFNLISKKEAKDLAVEQTVETVKAPEPVKEVEPEPVIESEPVPEAKEDEIVIIEKAEEVVPEQPPVEEKKPENIKYKIKWGDTLWDISDTYYKNPWRYKYIARWNGIKDPDVIISGTYITIPAE
ncbi:MAG: LysM peptidoglycan-binding domain-containing protein [Treponema sp.]|nr:LysM peptidoglycan-binding domain-containing protein [Treponema sp.]